jgi:hypothetical protein
MNKGHGKPHNDDQHRQITYFLPGQVVLHLEHPRNYSQKELVEDLQNFLKQNVGSHPWTRELVPPEAESVLTFSIQRGESQHSFVPVHLAHADTGQDSVARLLVEIFYQHQGRPILIREINGQQVKINSATPNWLAGGGIHGIGVSGPGAWPKEATIKQGDWVQFFEAKEIPNAKPGDGSGIHIAILDTAPCLSDLASAYEKWRKTDDEHSHSNVTAPNFLIDSLLRPKGILKVYPATLDELRLAAPYISLGHPYSMPDHGLFVAGIIHTFAPKATLHLYEVLNPYGAGCILNIIKGLNKAYENLGNHSPLIINCSLVLGILRDFKLDPTYIFASLGINLPNGFLEHLHAPIQLIFDLLERENVIVVAAAGNDAEGTPNGNPQDNRPLARYPAAYKSVIGVGSIRRQGSDNQIKIASYSNLACDPEDEGYLTLGGEEGEPEGILGAYISQLPNYSGPAPRPKRAVSTDQISYQPNRSGWVRWAGTSFATPIITGILAKWWDIGDHTGLTRAKSILDKFIEIKQSNGENVIIVKQEE